MHRPALTPESLRALVGCEAGVSPWIVVSQDMVNRFADLTGDHQFIHLDPERARAETPFDGTIAHGFLTLSLLSQMAAAALPVIAGTTLGINYGFDRIRFLAPVPSESRIRGRFALAEFSENEPGRATCRYQATVEIEGSSKPALVADWLTRFVYSHGSQQER